MVEIGPGHGTLGELAVAAGWRYHALEASPALLDVLREEGPDGHAGLGAAHPRCPTRATTWSTPTR